MHTLPTIRKSGPWAKEDGQHRKTSAARQNLVPHASTAPRKTCFTFSAQMQAVSLEGYIKSSRDISTAPACKHTRPQEGPTQRSQLHFVARCTCRGPKTARTGPQWSQADVGRKTYTCLLEGQRRGPQRHLQAVQSERCSARGQSASKKALTSLEKPKYLTKNEKRLSCSISSISSGLNLSLFSIACRLICEKSGR